MMMICLVFSQSVTDTISVAQVPGERERCESLDQAPLKGGRDDKVVI